MATSVTNGPSFFSLTMLQIVFLSTFFNFRDAWSDYNDNRQRLCPQEASVGLSIDARNASGFFTESGEFYPTHATRIIDGVGRGCICDLKPCLAICPPKGAAKGLRHPMDEYVNYAAIPRVHTTNRTIDVVADARGPEEWFRFFVWLPCPGKFKSYPLLPAINREHEFYLLGDGSLFVPGGNFIRAAFHDFGKYCLHLKSDNLSYIPRVCWPSNVESVDPHEDVNKIRFIGGLVAVPFIIATVIVYSVLPELRNIHGAALRCYLCCLAVTNVASAVDRLSDPDVDAGPWCMFLGFFIYFSFTAGILWLNVVCLDLWWRFGGFSALRSNDIQHDRKKFFWYSVYAWGISVFMTTICILMEFYPDIPESLIRPGFGDWACWFNTRAALALYHVGPTGLIVLCNIGLFVSTSMKLCRDDKISEDNFDTGTDSRRHNHNKQWFGLHLKLFLLMGICWSTDTFSTLWGNPKYWFAAETVNALQGLLIFLIFVCKKNIRHSLNERYGNKRPGANWCCRFSCFRISGNPSASQETGISN